MLVKFGQRSDLKSCIEYQNILMWRKISYDVLLHSNELIFTANIANCQDLYLHTSCFFCCRISLRRMVYNHRSSLFYLSNALFVLQKQFFRDHSRLCKFFIAQGISFSLPQHSIFNQQFICATVAFDMILMIIHI